MTELKTFNENFGMANQRIPKPINKAKAKKLIKEFYYKYFIGNAPIEFKEEKGE